MRRSYPQLILILLLCLAAGSVSAFAQGFRDTTFNTQITRGQAQSYASALQTNGMLIVGGSYIDANGERRSNLVRLDPNTGALDTTFNSGGTGPNAAVVTILPLPDGKIMIGGDFTLYNGAAANRVIRLNADGTRDTTFGGAGTPAGRITSMVRQDDGKVVIAGQGVANYNGATAWGWFRVNTDGTRDTTFVSQFNAAPGIDKVILQPDGKLVMSGGMTGYHGVLIQGVVRANADGTIDTTFNPSGAGTNGWVASMALQPDGKIVIGGGFATYNGAATGPFTRLLSNGTVDTTFVPPAMNAVTSYVNSLALQSNGSIVASGAMYYNDGTMTPIIRVNSSGANDASFNPGPSDNIAYDVKLNASGDIYMTGWFTRVGTITRQGVAKLTSSGVVDSGFNPSLTIQGRVMATFPLADGKIIVAGNFQAANGQEYKDVARLNADGTVDTTFTSGLGTGANNYRYTRNILGAELQPDGKILLAGDFGGLSGSGSGGLVRLRADGSLDNTFEMDATAFDYTRDVWVYDVAVAPDGKIICAGLSFASPAATGANIIWRLNPNGSIDNTFERKVGNSQALGVTITSTGKYLLTGNFTQYDAASSQRIVMVNTNGTKDAAFTGAANGLITNAIEQPDGKFVVYGSFTTLQSANRVRIGRLNANGTIDTTFQATASGGGADNTVRSMIRMPNGNFLVGGSFTNYGGTAINKVMLLNANGGLVTAFTSGLDAADTVHSVSRQADGKVILGGVFDAYSGAAARSIVRLTGPSFTGTGNPRTPFDFDGDGKADISVFRPSDGTWHALLSQNSQYYGNQFGTTGDTIAPADYDNDGKTDLAVWRVDASNPEFATFYIYNSATGTVDAQQFGTSGDDPSVVGDWDGDGKADLAVYRNASGGGQSYFYYRPSSQPGVNFNSVPWGTTGDIPVRGDYDGDGKIDAAVFRPSTGVWWIRSSQTGNVNAVAFGFGNDKLVQADYDGDGRTDIAIYRDGMWCILQSSNSQVIYANFGLGSDTPVPADYDGDGKADIAAFRSGQWFALRSTAGFLSASFGAATDVPTPSAYLP